MGTWKKALDRLDKFIENGICNYKVEGIDQIKNLFQDYHLTFTLVKYHRIKFGIKSTKSTKRKSMLKVSIILSELGCCEFSHNLLYWKELPEKNLQEKFDQFTWSSDEIKLEAWQGETGYPIVDAGWRAMENWLYA